MAERSKHLFQFTAAQIAAAAQECVEHHRVRLHWWSVERETALAEVKSGATVRIYEYPVSGGGMRTQLSVDSAHIGRVNECETKRDEHRKAIEEYQVRSALYGTQGDRTYELDGEDVAFFRLAGQKAPE